MQLQQRQAKRGARWHLHLLHTCSGNNSCCITWGLHYFVVAKDACRKREGVVVATPAYIDAVAVAVASTKGVQGGRGCMDKTKRMCKVCGGAEPSKSRLIFYISYLEKPSSNLGCLALRVNYLESSRSTYDSNSGERGSIFSVDLLSTTLHVTLLPGSLASKVVGRAPGASHAAVFQSQGAFRSAKPRRRCSRCCAATSTPLLGVLVAA